MGLPRSFQYGGKNLAARPTKSQVFSRAISSAEQRVDQTPSESDREAPQPAEQYSVYPDFSRISKIRSGQALESQRSSANMGYNRGPKNEEEKWTKKFEAVDSQLKRLESQTSKFLDVRKQLDLMLRNSKIVEAESPNLSRADLEKSVTELKAKIRNLKYLERLQDLEKTSGEG
jgi:hypothetical protein